MRAPGPRSATPRPAGESLWRRALVVCNAHLRFAMIFSALVNLAYLAPTIYMLQVYDRVVPSSSAPTLLFMTAALVAALLLLTYLDRIRGRILTSASVALDRAFGAQLLRRGLDEIVAGAPVRLNELVRNFDTLRMAVSGPAALAVFDAPWTPIYIIVCFIVHPLIGAMALGGAILLIALALANERVTRNVNRRAAAASAASYASQEGVGAAADVVRALGMREAFVTQFETARADASRLQLDGARASSRIGGVIRFLRLFLQSVAIGVGAWLAINKQISAGAIFASTMLTARALSPIDQIVAQWRTLSMAVTAYDVLKHHAADQPPAERTILPDPSPHLSVQNVAVQSAARDRFLLNGVRFEADGGAVIGVVGPSGAGKTTLLRLIANARAPDLGEILIGGARYADWDPERLGRLIGYLPQDSVLFPGTIKDNISRFDRSAGRSAADVDRLAIEAARGAEAHELILSLPSGYDTQLGARGSGLSAGQQQRVALARALYGAPLLYVLDEPNSSADSDAEAALIRVLARLKETGALVIVAAHRLSLIGCVDKIAVMSGGRLERFGPRDDVLRSLGVVPSGPPGAPQVAAQGGAQVAPRSAARGGPP